MHLLVRSEHVTEDLVSSSLHTLYWVHKSVCFNRFNAAREHSNVKIQRTTILLSSHNTSSLVQCFPSQNTNTSREEDKQINKQQKSDDRGKASWFNAMTSTPLPPPSPTASAIFCINYPKAITAALLTTLPRESDCSEQLGLSTLFYIYMLLIHSDSLTRRNKTNSLLVTLSLQAMLHNVFVVLVVGRQDMK